MRTLTGALLWSLFLLFAIQKSGKEAERRLAEYRGLVHLVSHIKSTLSHAPIPLSSVYESFSDEALARVGFLSLLREHGLSHALASGVLSQEEALLLPLCEYAEGLGKRLYAEELSAAGLLFDKVSATLASLEAALPTRRRLSGTLLFSGGMLILLLLL